MSLFESRSKESFNSTSLATVHPYRRKEECTLHLFQPRLEPSYAWCRGRRLVYMCNSSVAVLSNIAQQVSQAGSATEVLPPVWPRASLGLSRHCTAALELCHACRDVFMSAQPQLSLPLQRRHLPHPLTCMPACRSTIFGSTAPTWRRPPLGSSPMFSYVQWATRSSTSLPSARGSMGLSSAGKVPGLRRQQSLGGTCRSLCLFTCCLTLSTLLDT